ncbi:MAG: hypothetical protein J1F35_05700 [Erysipelotrichales bacterium]|nr:hypothetical protein [Erysipelotrichales bacterium]
MTEFQTYITLNESFIDNLSEDKKKEFEFGLENKYIFPLNNGNYLVHLEYYNSFMSEVLKNDKDPYGIPNVNFSQIDSQDARWKEYTKQRISRGFDDSEIWNLDSTIAKFILPRLKEFKEIAWGTPGKLDYEFVQKGYSESEASIIANKAWEEILDKMIWAFEHYDDESYILAADSVKAHEEYVNKINKGLKLFAEWFCSLNY